MVELIKKELKNFFASLSGYLILIFFLIANGVFLWIVPGVYNIPESGLADLQPFFSLAPMLYLFLVPALCMRLFAEEKRAGTLELLFTRPIAVVNIVGAKYVAGLLLVIFSLLPTVIYPVSLFLLAEPQGFVDTGGIVGSYVGLLLLAAVYVAAGVWASARTENQIVAFLYAMVVSFLLFDGFDMMAELSLLTPYRNELMMLGIEYHYEPMSRGVIALNNVVYFLSVITAFLFLTVRRFRRVGGIFWYVVAGLLIVNVIAGAVYVRVDITNDKRYTLSENTRELLRRLDKHVGVEVFLAGNLPPDMQKLQYAVTRMLEEFARMANNRITYELVAPEDVKDMEEKKQLVSYLAQRGILPVNHNRTTEDDQLRQQFVFPGLIVYDDSTEVSVNLWKVIPGLSGEENVNYAVESLEYELTNALRLITRREKKAVAFLTGQGEYDYPEVADMAKTLSYYYQVDFVDSDTIGADIDHYKALIIAGPTSAFTDEARYIIDQFVMHGGRVLWCLDEVLVDHDALREQETTYAMYNPLNVEDMLFKYGVRINPDVLIDGNSVLIPVVTAVHGTTPEYTPAPWYFSPLLVSHNDHPVVNGIAPVRVDYANSIDTVGGSERLKKTVLLSSSDHAALLRTPCPVSLSITEKKMTRDRFNRAFVPVAVMVEGVFESLFRFNKRAEERVDKPFRQASDKNRMIVVSDGDIIRNKVRGGAGENRKILPLGYDEYADRMYGNKDFLLNAVNMLCDDEGWMALRGRTLSLYLLDKTRLKSERTRWQMLNLFLPLLLVSTGGLLFYAIRRRKFGREFRPGTREKEASETYVT